MITGYRTKKLKFYKEFYLRNLEKVPKVMSNVYEKVAGLPQLLLPEQEPVVLEFNMSLILAHQVNIILIVCKN